MVTSGEGTLIGNAGAAVANSIINVYPNESANDIRRLEQQRDKCRTTGDFTRIHLQNAPDNVYVTQQSTSNKGIMLESAPVPIEKAVLDTITPLNEVKATDLKGF